MDSGQFWQSVANTNNAFGIVGSLFGTVASIFTILTFYGISRTRHEIERVRTEISEAKPRENALEYRVKFPNLRRQDNDVGIVEFLQAWREIAKKDTPAPQHPLKHPLRAGAEHATLLNLAYPVSIDAVCRKVVSEARLGSDGIMQASKAFFEANPDLFVIVSERPRIARLQDWATELPID